MRDRVDIPGVRLAVALPGVPLPPPPGLPGLGRGVHGLPAAGAGRALVGAVPQVAAVVGLPLPIVGVVVFLTIF